MRRSDIVTLLAVLLALGALGVYLSYRGIGWPGQNQGGNPWSQAQPEVRQDGDTSPSWLLAAVDVVDRAEDPPLQEVGKHGRVEAVPKATSEDSSSVAEGETAPESDVLCEASAAGDVSDQRLLNLCLEALAAELRLRSANPADIGTTGLVEADLSAHAIETIVQELPQDVATVVEPVLAGEPLDLGDVADLVDADPSSGGRACHESVRLPPLASVGVEADLVCALDELAGVLEAEQVP